MTQETSSDQPDTTSVVAVGAPRELKAANKVYSEMSAVAAPLQSTASGVSGTNNPIGLVDWISSFLKTLKQFNGVVDNIATVSIAMLASPSMLIQYTDSSLRASSVDYPLFCF